MRKQLSSRFGVAIILSLGLILAACSREEPSPTAAPENLTVAPEEPTQVPAEPTSVLEPTEPVTHPAPETYPATAVSYNLGETTIVQDHFPEDSPFRDMPVRLNGVIGLPESDQRHPVVLIMHGSHAACPDEKAWPCPAEEEHANYEGFTYLVEALAEAGYVALSINVNAEHTLAFGEAPPTVRTKQLIDLHLSELAAADAGESDRFGLDLTDRVDLSRLVWMGHSRGGEFANRILREHHLTETEDESRNEPGYGPVQGLVQIAPALIIQDSLPAADLAIAIILPACDRDVIELAGQSYYESTRLDPERQHFAISVYLEGAVHNSFNAILEPESVEPIADRPDCSVEALISADDQQKFLANYTVDFLQMLYAEADLARAAGRRLGTPPTEPVPDRLYDLPVKVNFLPDPANILALVVPESEQALSKNLLGGEVQMEGVTAVFCPQGYYVPANEPGTEPCKRVNFNQPGFPQQLVIEWDASGAEWRTSLPASAADLSPFAALQLRVALDPLSDLNTEGQPQSFTVEVVDADNQRAHVIVPTVEYPIGVRRPNEFFEGGSFTGHVPMQTLRIPLEEFNDVDLANVAEIALLFDQHESGTLFVADLALVQDDSK